MPVAPRSHATSTPKSSLLSAVANRPKAELLRHIVKDIAEGLEFLVDSLRRARPNSTLVLTTIYDPSDDTRRIPGVFDNAGPLPLESVDEILLLMSWFRAHPDALRRTTPLTDWLPDQSSSPGDTSGPARGALIAASQLLTTI